MDKIINYTGPVDTAEDLIFDKKDGGVRLLQAILLKAVTEVMNQGLIRQDRLQACYWLFLDDNEDELVIRSLALKLFDMDLGYIRRKVISKIGRKEFGRLLVDAISLPEKDKFWA